MFSKLSFLAGCYLERFVDGWPSVFHSYFIRHKLVSNLVSSDISDHGTGHIVCPKSTDGCPCFFAVHGEVVVFPPCLSRSYVVVIK